MKRSSRNFQSSSSKRKFQAIDRYRKYHNIPYYSLLVTPKNLHKYSFQFLLGPFYGMLWYFCSGQLPRIFFCLRTTRNFQMTVPFRYNFRSLSNNYYNYNSQKTLVGCGCGGGTDLLVSLIVTVKMLFPSNSV